MDDGNGNVIQKFLQSAFYPWSAVCILPLTTLFCKMSSPGAKYYVWKGVCPVDLGIIVSNVNCISPLLIDLRNFYFDCSECTRCILGSALVKVGTTEKKLGQAERDLKAKSMSHFLHQLKTFLEGDMKTISVSTCDAI